MSCWDDLAAAVEELRTAGCGKLTVMQCSSFYPCGPQQVGLNVISEIQQRFGYGIGFQIIRLDQPPLFRQLLLVRFVESILPFQI